MRSLVAPFTALLFSIGCILGIPSPGGARPWVIAQAETPPAEESPPPSRARSDIEEIVVQAGESEATADLTAGDSVTGFDSSDLEALGAQSIEDLAGFTPNLEIVSSGATTPTFFIRGVGLNDFNPNSSGSVAIYTDDVPKNAPAIQLGTLFDVENVNVLRGPQGTGPFRSASAGAIKVYSRKPSGRFGGYFRSEFGNYNFQDYEGAVEMPIFEDIVSGRVAFRLSARDGFSDNRCGNAPPFAQRPVYQRLPGEPQVAPRQFDLIHLVTPAVVQDVFNQTGAQIKPGASVCGETVFRLGQRDTLSTGLISDGISDLPPGLPDEVNDLGNWATRAMLRFQPTLDQDWLLTGHLSMRDEFSRLGQSYGTGVGSGNAHYICDLNLPEDQRDPACRVAQTLGSPDGAEYQAIENVFSLRAADPCTFDFPTRQLATNTGIINPAACSIPLIRDNSRNQAEIGVQSGLGDLDKLPYEGDYNKVGDTTNDVWGTSLKGEIALGGGMQLRTVTGYDTYDRFVEVDLDFSPNTLFEIETADEGWQFVQDLQLSGYLSNTLPLGWNVGAFMLLENLEAPNVNLDFTFVTDSIAVIQRNWEQDLLSLAGYAGFDFDFWEDFTVDGGVRYNWEQKSLELTTFTNPDLANNTGGNQFEEDNVWQDPTGQLRLTYRFREDTQAYWKYTRGWKGGHYNVTANQLRGITIAEPEVIDSFEVGLQGSWFNGRLGFDASLFHYAYENYQIFTVQIPLVGNPEFVVLNASDAEVYGGEMDIVARPLPGMFIQARLSWLESQFIDFVQTQARSNVIGNQREDLVTEIDNSGNTLLNSPEFKVGLTAEQTFQLGRFGSLTGRWDGAWTDDTYYSPTEGRGIGDFGGNKFLPKNTIGQEAFWLHNFRLEYRTPDGSVTVGAWVRNAFDEVYKTFAFDASPLAINRTTIFFTGEPRTYGGSLTVIF